MKFTPNGQEEQSQTPQDAPPFVAATAARFPGILREYEGSNKDWPKDLIRIGRRSRGNRWCSDANRDSRGWRRERVVEDEERERERAPPVLRSVCVSGGPVPILYKSFANMSLSF